MFVIGWTFFTTIPAVVMAFTVTIFFAVGFIMFFVIADQVVQGKAVVAGDEVDGKK